MGFPHRSVGKESACSAGDPGSIPGMGRSPGEGNGNPLHYSRLQNPMDRGAWQSTVHGVTRVGHDLATKQPTIFYTFNDIFHYPVSDYNSTLANCRKCSRYIKVQRGNHLLYHSVQFSSAQFSSVQFSSVQFSCSVMSDSLWPHGLQDARPPCPLPTPKVYSNS